MTYSAYTQTIKECLKARESSENGLSAEEAAARLKEHGENRLPEEKVPPVWLIFLRQFMSPLIYILLFAGVVTVFLKEYPGAIFIFAVLLINAVIGTVQEYSANQAAAALKKMATSLARIKRDGSIQEVDATKLVPGDIVLLETGNKVPADMRLMETSLLKVDESLLTGESKNVSKQADITLEEDLPVSEQENMAFAGTMVTGGRAVGVVVATGSGTRMGEIAKHITEKSKAESPLIIRMERFTMKISFLVGLLIVVIATILYLQSQELEHIFLIAVGLAVASIPEGLPVTLTIALAVGMRRMARRNVIVRRLVAVESLGSCTIIAADKTGTLTRNELTTEKLVLPSGKTFNVTTGDTPVEGSITSDGENSEAIDINKKYPALHTLHEAAVLASEGELHHEKDSWHINGDAVDGALLMMARKSGFTRQELLEIYPQTSSIPYESHQKFAASMHEKDSKTYVFVKGAVETLLEMCSGQIAEDGQTALDKNGIIRQEQDLSEHQFRVLAFAYGEIETKEEYTKDDLKNLTFLGITGMRDPLREEAKSSIEQCHKAGIEVVMITGDHPETAFAIAHELGLSDKKEEVVTGKKLLKAKQQGEKTLDALTRKSKVYARIEPGQKLDIVDSLIRNGHFVAMTGDGVNDAPALKHAHVGVAMGKKGTDVARESSEIILTDDNFASIVSGIEEGRNAYGNIRKIVFFLISTSLSEVLMFLTTIVLRMPIPLFATQLLWINFVTGIVQHIALSFDPPEGRELKQPPRNPKEPIFDRIMITRVGLLTGCMGLIVCGEFYWMLHSGNYSEVEARNLVLLQFVLFENIVVLNSRSETLSIFSQPLMQNPLLVYGTIAAQGIHIAAMYIPGLSDVLYIHPVTLAEWGALLGIAFIVMAVIEMEKWIRRRYTKRKRTV